MFINHKYHKSLKLRKDYEGVVYYKLRMEGKASENMVVEFKAQGQTIRSSGTDLGGIIDSSISSDKEIDIELTIESTECGDMSAYFYIEVQDGAPLSFQFRASFKGPALKIIEPVVDFGLMKINTSSKYLINVENTSPIPCEVMVKSFKYDHITFKNYREHLSELK